MMAIVSTDRGPDLGVVGAVESANVKDLGNVKDPLVVHYIGKVARVHEVRRRFPVGGHAQEHCTRATSPSPRHDV